MYGIQEWRGLGSCKDNIAPDKQLLGIIITKSRSKNFLEDANALDPKLVYRKILATADKLNLAAVAAVAVGCVMPKANAPSKGFGALRELIKTELTFHSYLENLSLNLSPARREILNFWSGSYYK